MKTIEELANLGALAAYSGRGQQEYNISINSESSFWEKDRPAREAFARAVRDAVLAEVPTWRPIAELPDDDGIYLYWDGTMAWSGSTRHKADSSHFSFPPKADPFEAWWASHKTCVNSKETARHAWNAAREAKA